MNLRITDHPGLRKFLTAVLFFAAVIFLMFFRNPRIFTDPEPFWEDMSIFLAQEYIVGFPDTLLITHSGYLHVIPRIVAWIGLCFGLSHAMAVMNLIVLLFKALVAFNLWHYRRKPAVWFFFLFALAYLASIYYNFVERLVEFEGTFIYGFSRERYFVFPRVCTMLLMLSSLNILIDFLLRNRAAKVLNGVKAAVFAALCLAMLPHYTVGFPFHNQWDDDVRKFEAAKSGETVHFNYESDCGCNIEGTCYICELTKK